MKKNYLFIALLTLLSTSQMVLAGDEHYVPPAQIECVAPSQCRYDNTYISLYMAGKGVPAGIYTFKGVTVMEVRSGEFDFALLYGKADENNPSTTIFINGEIPFLMTRMDLKAPGNKWQKYTDNNYFCASENPKECGFTHTPWHRKIAPLQGNTSEKLLPIHEIYKRKPAEKSYSKQYIDSLTGDVFVKNATPYPLVVNKSDFNHAFFTDPNTFNEVAFPIIVPAKSEGVIARYKRASVKDSIMLDIKLGNHNAKMDDRNVKNTSVIFQEGQAFAEIYNRILTVDQKPYLVGEGFPATFQLSEINIVVGPCDVDWICKR